MYGLHECKPLDEILIKEIDVFLRAPTMVIYRLSTRDPYQHIFLLGMY